MFLSDKNIKKLGFHTNEADIRACTLYLHVSKTFDLNNKEKDLPGNGITMGGFEYPRHMTFLTKEEINLDNSTVGLVFGRQEFALRNLLVFPGIVHPGFSGQLFIQTICLGGNVRIQEDDPIAYIAFSKTESEVENPLDMNKWKRKHGL